MPSSPPTILEHPWGTIEDGDAFHERIKFFLEPPFDSKFGAMWLDQLDDPGDEHEWLVDDWLSCGDISVLAADSRTGKTFVGLELAFDIVYGREFLGKNTKRGGVIYQTGEGGKAIRKRIRAIRAHRGLNFSRETPFVLLRRKIDIYADTEMVEDLIKEIIDHSKHMLVPLLLVIIDTLATATTGADEISGKDMGKVMSNVRRISEKTRAAVMLIHHLSAGGRVRGHTSVYANVEQVWLLERDEQNGVRTLICDKQKDGDEGAKLNFELVKVPLGFDETGKVVDSCICQAVSEREAAQREEAIKGARLSPAVELFMGAYFEAEKRYGVFPPENGFPPQVRNILLWDDVKLLYAERNPPDALTPDQQTEFEAAKAREKHTDTIRKRLRQCREHAINEGVLGIKWHDQKTYCFWTGKPIRAFPHTQAEKRDDPELDKMF